MVKSIKYCFLGVLLAAIVACSGQDTTPYQWNLPDSIPPPPLPEQAVMTQASVELGRHLFYDTGLSGNGTLACASCHMQGLAFADNRAKSVGAEGEVLKRNALALVNVAYHSTLTWAHNGITQPEQQILLPLFNEHPVEMGVTGNEAVILERLRSAQYQRLFEHAFGNPEPTWQNIVLALSSFVRTLVSFRSPFDAYAYGGDDDALSEQALAGLNLFFSERLECFHCHGGINFTQSSRHTSQAVLIKPFHHTGFFTGQGDTGLYDVTRDPNDLGRFRAPTLRNIAVTAPYMHDGSLQTLEQVIEFYENGGRGEGKYDPRKSPFITGFALNDEERQALLAFLHSLTDDQFLSNPAHSAPFAVPE
ncbi:di-heme enzyme [Alteromonas sediminis]|uniref:Di-heme enzyme n=1 Tax=Alteromonas sediminis TaxID=2259342 RepID=A0A3N5Y5D4_9ALTE|nr:MbnH family di-heme enzyme [Alteromonas sediminis]RPJ68246.1 di-heme enzyme [Alteromonas sediminis]